MEHEEWERVRWWEGDLSLHLGSMAAGSRMGASLESSRHDTTRVP